jgi:hypothetical protein
MEIETSPETPCMLKQPQTRDNVQHSFSFLNQPSSQTFRELLMFLTERLIEQLTAYEDDK